MPGTDCLDRLATSNAPPLAPSASTPPSATAPSTMHPPTPSPGDSQTTASLPPFWARHERVIKFVIVVVAAGLLAAAIVRRGGLPGALGGQFGVTGRFFWAALLTNSGLMLAVFVWRLVLWLRYRPMAPVDAAELPSISVIIPAYNEGALVQRAILSVAASRYPAERIEIIAIDDGSSDDTWSHILAAAGQAPADVRIQTIRQPHNLGKRRALHRGFQAAVGDVFITVDSDCVLEPDALANAVTPLVRDPAIGCVAGCVRVLNAGQSLFTRFLKCTFSLSFRFVRAYQNEFRGVFCTPGALSVYRADLVRRVMDEWVNQRFLGRPCMTGEDRAMTNLLLREGALTAYQDNAVVHAHMPHTYRGMANMFLRWARSNIRETIFLYAFLFTRFRTRHLAAFRLNMVLVTFSLVLPTLTIAGALGWLMTHPDLWLDHLAVVLLYAVVSALIYRRNERDGDWVWLLAYAPVWILGVSWIMLYAALTLGNTGWLTRGDPETGRAGWAPTEIGVATQSAGCAGLGGDVLALR